MKLIKRSHARRCTIRRLTHWLKKTSDEKRGNPKKRKGPKNTSNKKRGNPKNARDSKRLPMKKEATLKSRGSKRALMKKEATPKMLGAKKKTFDEKGDNTKHKGLRKTPVPKNTPSSNKK
jgi:hypothetical protein